MINSSHVLVVEDEAVVRQYACELLLDLGYPTLQASSADEGLAILQNRADIAVVMTDVVMPGTLDGLAFVGAIRRQRPDIGVIVTSGRLPADAVSRADGTLFLAKPFTFEALENALTNLIGQRETA